MGSFQIDFGLTVSILLKLEEIYFHSCILAGITYYNEIIEVSKYNSVTTIL